MLTTISPPYDGMVFVVFLYEKPNLHLVAMREPEFRKLQFLQKIEAGIIQLSRVVLYRTLSF